MKELLEKINITYTLKINENPACKVSSWECICLFLLNKLQ